MGNGGNHVVAGLAAAFALPLGVFALGLPLVIALPVAAALYAGLALALAPRPRTARIDFGKIDRAQAAIAAELIGEGEASVVRLQTAGRKLASVEGRQTVERLAGAARKILDRLAAEPEKLPPVRRFLTYYLPRSAEIAEGLGTVERQVTPDSARRAEIEAILARLGQAFSFYADNLDQTDLASLDVELKLVDRALAEDIGPPATSSGRAAPSPIRRR